MKGNCQLIVEQKGVSQSPSVFCSASGSVNSHITLVAWFLENEGGMAETRRNNSIGFARVFVMENYSLYCCYGSSARKLKVLVFNGIFLSGKNFIILLLDSMLFDPWF